MIPKQINEIRIISATPYSALSLTLRQLLLSMHIQVIPPNQPAAFSLSIERETFRSNSMTQSASSSSQQYILYYDVTYHLENRAGQTLFGPKTLTLSETYSVNQNQVLTTSTIQTTLQTKLQEDAAYQILSQLSAQEAQAAIATSLSAPVAPVPAKP